MGLGPGLWLAPEATVRKTQGRQGSDQWTPMEASGPAQDAALRAAWRRHREERVPGSFPLAPLLLHRLWAPLWELSAPS